MSEEDQESITEPFAQGRNALARSVGGTGLGLALTTALINRHGGKLVIESTETKGTTARLMFPTRRVVSAPPSPSSAIQATASAS